MNIVAIMIIGSLLVALCVAGCAARLRLNANDGIWFVIQMMVAMHLVAIMNVQSFKDGTFKDLMAEGLVTEEVIAIIVTELCSGEHICSLDELERRKKEALWREEK